MRRIVFVLLVLLVVSASGINPLTDKRPESVTADAQVNETAIVDEAPEKANVQTNITIIRETPAQIYAGDTFDVKIKVTNHYSSELNILVIEPLRDYVGYSGGPEPYTVNYEGFQVRLFKWTGKIQPGETKTYAYKITAGSPGGVTLPPASVNDDYGNAFESRPSTITVDCKPDGKCGPGENYIICPQDCPTGSADDTCDGAEDGRIDPDCEANADPDTSKVMTTTLPPNTKKPTGMCNFITLPLLTLLTAILTRKI